MAVAHVQVSFPPAYVEVDVAAGVGAAPRAASGLHRAVVARRAVLLQHDVNDAGAALGTELCRRVVDDLYPVNALGRQLLEYLGAVVAGQSAGLAVDPHLHAGVAAQRYVALRVDLDRRDVLEHVARRTAGVAYVLRHVERLAVNLELHARALRRHRDLLQRLAVLREAYFLKIGVLVLGLKREALYKLGVAYVRQLHGVAAVGQTRNIEQALLVRYCTLYKFLRGLVVHGDVDERHRAARSRVYHLSPDAALRMAEDNAHNE